MYTDDNLNIQTFLTDGFKSKKEIDEFVYICVLNKKNDQWHPHEAYYYLGEMYRNAGEEEEAIEWHLHNIEKYSDTASMNALVDIFILKGEYIKAIDLKEKCAELSAPARRHFAEWYYKGYIVEKNIMKALQLMKEAANMGDEIARKSVKEIEDTMYSSNHQRVKRRDLTIKELIIRQQYPNNSLIHNA